MAEFKSPLFSRYIFRYITREVFYSFLMGTVIFLSIMLLFQAIRLSEFIINQQVSVYDIAKMAYYLMLSFLPVALPIAFLFAVVMGISRANSEGEILALQVNGISIDQIYRPILVFSVLVTSICLYTSLYSVPKGNRGFELLVTRLGGESLMANLKAGVFMEGFFGLVLYTEKISPVTYEMSRMFIYDERDPEHPFAITARAGILNQNIEEGLFTLRLTDGAIFVEKGKPGGVQQKIVFDVYDINLVVDRGGGGWRTKSLPSLTYPEVLERLEIVKHDPDQRSYLHLLVELHRRYSMSFACIVFGALGFFLGTLNLKGIRSSSIILCLGVGIVYWLSYVAGNALALSEKIMPWLAIWLPNFIFGSIPVYLYLKQRKPG